MGQPSLQVEKTTPATLGKPTALENHPSAQMAAKNRNVHFNYFRKNNDMKLAGVEHATKKKKNNIHILQMKWVVLEASSHWI